MNRGSILKKVRRIVIKIGTSSITEGNNVSSEKISKFAREIVELKGRGYEIAIVTSGAISSGAGILNISRSNRSIPEKQALAAVGQSVLMNEYARCFKELGYIAGQVLLTEDDMTNRKRFLNARNAMNSLFDLNVIPVINENDTVAVSEIRFGDNDTLSAHVFNLIEADLLILLSDIDGFYNDLEDSAPVYEIFRITDDIRRKSGGVGSKHGTGGMITKINAAEMIMRFGGKMIIADGSEPGILVRLMEGEKHGTLFMGEAVRIPGRKKWISMRKSRGSVVIDSGAVRAIITRKKSLLASGITAVVGKFDMGDIVDILDPEKKLVAKGIVNYRSDELSEIKGMKTTEIRELFKEHFFEEVINRDDMVIINHADE